MCVSSGMRVCVLGRAVQAPVHGLSLLLSVISPSFNTRPLSLLQRGEAEESWEVFMYQSWKWHKWVSLTLRGQNEVTWLQSNDENMENTDHLCVQEENGMGLMTTSLLCHNIKRRYWAMLGGWEWRWPWPQRTDSWKRDSKKQMKIAIQWDEWNLVTTWRP